MAKQTFTTGQVLTAAQMTSLQQTAMGGGSTTAKTTSYVLVAADAGTVVQMNSASATTITVNTALFAAGDTVQIQNVGAGVCTVTAGTATVSTSAVLALKQYDAGSLYFNTTSAALFFAADAADNTSPLTTKGDLYGFSTLNARIPIGTNNQVLTADSAEGLGLKWATPTATTFPAFRAYQNTNQTVSANTFTKINFQAEDFDTDGCFASSRFTPTTAGKYFFNWTLDVNSLSVRNIMFYKNGSNVAGMFFNSPQSHATMQNSTFYSMNGTTDYMEVYAYIDASTTIQSGSEYSYFEGFGVRT